MPVHHRAEQAGGFDCRGCRGICDPTMPPTSFDIGFSLNPCPRKPGAPQYPLPEYCSDRCAVAVPNGRQGQWQLQTAEPHRRALMVAALASATARRPPLLPPYPRKVDLLG